MSVEQAQQLVTRLLQDEGFRRKLESAPPDQRRAVLTEAGYGDVRLRHLSDALPGSHGGELTDEEFAAVAGGVSKKELTSALASAGGSVVTGGVVAGLAAAVL